MITGVLVTLQSPVYPTRPVNTGVILDTCVHGPWTRVVCTELKGTLRSSAAWRRGESQRNTTFTHLNQV